MADLIAYQDGNWTGATTWKGTVTSTGAKQTDISASTTTTTAYITSQAFTVTNAVVVEGLLLHCHRESTTGTVTVALSNDNGVSWVREVTINTADLPTAASWVFFKFGTTLTGDGGTDYRVGVKSSSASTTRFFRSSLSGNWARYLRTDATATAAASDVTFICDEWTAAGTKTDITVTMNSTASTTYGEVNIGHGGVLSYGTAASTNYILDLGGNLNIWANGTLNIGTSGTPIPSTSTAVLEWTTATNVLYGLEAREGSTLNIYGATKSNTRSLLTADAAFLATSLTVESTADWVSGDLIGIAPTRRTPSEVERRTISTVPSGTTLTFSGGLSNPHTGTDPYIGEVINLTRNVKVRGTSQTLCAYLNLAATSTVNISYAEFYWLGSSTTSKRGIDVATTSGGVFNISYCSFYDYNATSSIGLNITGNSQAVSVTYNNFYWTAGGAAVSMAATSGTPTFSDNWGMGSTSGGIGITDAGVTAQNNRVAGIVFTIAETAGNYGTISNNVIHSNSSQSLYNGNGTLSNFTIWRNSGGVELRIPGTVFDNCSIYHNGVNIVMSNGLQGGTVFKNCSIQAGSGSGVASTTAHVSVSLGCYDVTFDSCSIGTVAQASAFFSLGTTAQPVDIVFRNCAIAGMSTTITNNGLLRNDSYFESGIKFDKFNQTSGSHRVYKRYGRNDSDQGTFRTTAPSEAMLPSGGSGNKLWSGTKSFGVLSGTTATVTVYVYKSATYNGNQPRLMVRANSIAGISSDTVLATASGGTGSWLTLTGTTATVADDCVLEVFVDCDGTAGTVYVDDWSVT